MKLLPCCLAVGPDTLKKTVSEPTDGDRHVHSDGANDSPFNLLMSHIVNNVWTALT